jgi:hypothetical protein
MKKWIILGISIAALAVLTVGGFVWAGKAYAQAQEPPYPNYSYGMMGGRYGGYGMMGGYGMWGAGGYGPMHQYMIDALAKAFNLTSEQLQARFDQGETPWKIAQSQGLSAEQFQNAMQEAQDQALEAAVKGGVLTQQQADWMDQHMESMWSGGFGCFGGYPDTDGTTTPNSGANNTPNGANKANPGNNYGPMMRSY